MSKVDYQYWASLDRWQEKEAALLIDGKDPEQHRSIRGLTAKDVPAALAQAAKISKFLARVDWFGRYGVRDYEAKIHPAFIVRAVLDAGWGVPVDLRTAIQPRLDRLNAFLKANREQDELGNATATTKERQTMLKLILGLACGGYGIDPEEGSRNLKAKEMRADLERFGIGLDDGTIKKYLDEAKRLRRKLLIEAAEPD